MIALGDRSDRPGRSGDRPGDRFGRSNLPDQRSPSDSLPREQGDRFGRSPEGSARNGRAEHHDARLALADSIWGAQEARRRVLRQGGVGQGTRDLSLASPGKLELLRRIDESASDGRGLDRAREDCEHVLDVNEAEARELGTLFWFDGNHWKPERWQRAMSMSVEEAIERARARRAREQGNAGGERRTYRPTGKENYQGGDEIP